MLCEAYGERVSTICLTFCGYLGLRPLVISPDLSESIRVLNLAEVRVSALPWLTRAYVLVNLNFASCLENSGPSSFFFSRFALRLSISIRRSMRRWARVGFSPTGIIGLARPHTPIYVLFWLVYKGFILTISVYTQVILSFFLIY